MAERMTADERTQVLLCGPGSGDIDTLHRRVIAAILAAEREAVVVFAMWALATTCREQAEDWVTRWEQEQKGT